MQSQAATVDGVKKIIQEDLVACDGQQSAAFKMYSIEPCPFPILRNGKMESVMVVARRGAEVIYWEDIEEGFNVSPLGKDGRILDRRCNQDTLGLALDAWIDGRARTVDVGAAIPVE
jgi:hypothetical protein